MREARNRSYWGTITEGTTVCPACHQDYLVQNTRITRVAWVMLASGLAFAPFTAGFSLVFPVAALFLREPIWHCENCWRHGSVAADHTVAPEWRHHPHA